VVLVDADGWEYPVLPSFNMNRNSIPYSNV